MVLTDDLPTDSVLHRHALTERNRQLGLPPSDAVLRRHYDQLQAALLQGSRAVGTVGAVGAVGAVGSSPRSEAAPARVAAAAPAAAVASPSRAAPPQPAAASTTPPAATPTAQAASGGLFGWLRRLLGA